MTKGEHKQVFISKNDTFTLKGIAIIAMLCHHVYGCTLERCIPYSGYFGFIGNVGKVCVAIFVFCSAYGLSVNYEKVLRNTDCQNIWTRCKSVCKFLAKRFIKFYANYWPIFVVFVSLGVFVFGRTLNDAYGEAVNIPKRLLYDFIGIQGFNSYNITWWFNKLIIILYLIFPLVHWLCNRKSWILMLLLSFGLLFYTDELNYGFIPNICMYLFPFVLGIVCAIKGNAISNMISTKGHNRWLIFIGVILCVILCTVIRVKEIVPHFDGIRVDGLLTLSLVLLIVIVRKILNYQFRILPFIGKYSATMYLTHTFFMLYWFPSFFYSANHPVCSVGGAVRSVISNSYVIRVYET